MIRILKEYHDNKKRTTGLIHVKVGSHSGIKGKQETEMGWDEYLLKQPRTLESMAVNTLGDLIKSQVEKIASLITKIQQQDPTEAEELLSKQIKTMRNHLNRRLPRIFHDKAMIEVKQTLCHLSLVANMYSERIPEIVIRRMIETMFTKHLTRLSLVDSDWENFKVPFYFKLPLLTGLTHLKLTILPLADVTTDDVLKRIVENCKLIETLELSYSDVSDDSVKILTKLNNLKSVDVRETAVSEIGIENVLLSCENIEHIFTDIDVAQVIDDIVYFKKRVGETFKLKSYQNGLETTLEQLQLVVDMCPLIEKVSLEKEEDADWRNYLTPLNDLKNLRELELYFCEFYSDQVKELLRAMGCNLVQLRLGQVLEIDFSALKYIYLTCPNLQSLTLRKCQFVEGMQEDDPFPSEITIPPLEHLKRIMMTGFNSWRPDEHLAFMLSNCLSLEYIDISGIATLKDDFISQLLEKNPKNLMFLKELRIRRKLSVMAIKQVVRDCVNLPEIIARHS